MQSQTLRRIFAHYHGVEIGMYTYGECFVPDAFGPSTTIGRYCSLASDIRAFRRNHPLHFKSTHAFFFNTDLGYCKREVVDYVPLMIGSDVWIGHGAIILPCVTEIGHGSVVGAGTVVNKNVPPYAVVIGNPSRIVRYRFSPETIEKLLESRWWKKSIYELSPSEFSATYLNASG